MNIDEYYTVEDFAALEKADAHLHINTANSAFGEILRDNNFRCISINTEVPGFPSIEDQQNFIVQQRVNYPEHIFHLATFETRTLFENGWAARQLDYLKESFLKGAVGVKVWKNIGMDIKNRAGKFVMIDDSVFDPIIDYLEQNKIPLCGHIGEPKNCWLPLDQMTTSNDRAYFKDHPEYHLYLHPEFPAYDEILEHRDNLLVKHPRLLFVGAHLGSMEWSVDEMVKRLERFPYLMLDLAERISHIQYQCIDEWQKVREFFIKYQDRILYGTDLIINEDDDKDSLSTRCEDLWLRDWRFFTTGEEMESPLVNGRFKCLRLPKGVIDKIYNENALKRYFTQQ